MYLRLVFIVVFCLIFLSPFVWAEQSLPNSQETIDLTIGDTKEISITGDTPFVEDSDVLSLSQKSGTTYTISAKSAGSTHVYYWKGDVLKYFTINVIMPNLRRSTEGGPSFVPNQPYFLYSFQNSSSFDKNSFYQSPAYYHSLSATTPFWGSSTLQGFVDYQHDSQIEEGILNQANLQFQNGPTRIFMGNIAPSFSRLPLTASGALLLGTELAISLEKAHTHHDIQFYGGFSSPDHLLDATLDRPLFGFHYEITHSLENSYLPNYLATGFFSYQDQDFNNYNFGGGLDANLNIARGLSSQASYFQGKGGFALGVNPLFDNQKTRIETSYLFLKAGLEGYQVDPETSDNHLAEWSWNQYLNDDKTLFAMAGSFAKTIPRLAGSEDADAYSTALALSLQRNLSYRSSYGVTYGTSYGKSAATPSYSNSLGLNWIHPYKTVGSLSHAISYQRQDLTSSSNTISVSNVFSLENYQWAYDTSLGMSYSSLADTGAVILDQSISFNLVRGTLGAALIYLLPSFTEPETQSLSLATQFNYYLTSVTYINLTSSFSTILTNPNGFSGGFSMSLSKYLGPGVEQDSLLKRFFGGGTGKSQIEGYVFVDGNYDMYLNEGDKALAGVKIIIDDKITLISNSLGYFTGPKIKVGLHKLVIDPDFFKNHPNFDIVPPVLFSNQGGKKRTLSLPITKKGVSLRILCVLDNDDNKKYDYEADSLISMPLFYLKPPQGEEIKIDTGRYGGGLVKGLKKGRYEVRYDPLDLPDGVIAITPYKQVIVLQENKENDLAFLFKAIRFVRGTVSVDDGSKPPRGLVITVGTKKITADSGGSFFIPNLESGLQPVTVKNLPNSYCLKQELSDIMIGSGNSQNELDIVLTKNCSKKE